MNNKDIEKLNEYRGRFKKMTDEELLDIKQRESKQRGWVRSRQFFLSALKDELAERNLVNTEMTFVSRMPDRYKKHIVGKHSDENISNSD